MTRLLLIAGAGLVCAVQPASAQRLQVAPYIEASQVLTSDLTNGADLLTYSTIGAGVDVTAQTRRVEVQVSYNYERRFAYDKQLANDQTHSGLARVRARVTPALSIEAGAIATRTRSDIRGDALVTDQGNVRNSSQIYSAFIGPNLSTNIGPLFANAAYRFGYTKVEAPFATGVAPGQPRLDYYDDSKVHVATASIGAKSGTILPVGVTASGSFTREDAGQLDQRFEGKFLRGDVVVPVSRGVAVAGGVGYENIEISQRDALLTPAGAPVVDNRGRFVTDPSSPRRIAYDFDGLFWDAGVIWRPSSRTFLEARVGRRYGSMSYTGSASYEIGKGSGVQIGVYDSVETFGQQVGNSLSSLPTSFQTSNDPFGNQYSGCIYGTTGAAAGGCLNQVFASSATSAFRSRGITGVAVLNTRGTRIGVGGGYSRRDFIAPRSTGTVSINGVTDEAVYAQLFASGEVGRNGSVSSSLFASYTDTDLAGAEGVLGWGANTAYTHSFGQLGAIASLGLFGFERDGDTSASAQALVGLRYGF
ncbi:hypothetical protein [Sphingomonas sp. M1-B02]|uniref:hypothetical protein n=1 Tax=Sphingomonas sp. M1-B02 TaxID=3114300 RepID=UPI00223FDFB8|nr:hypothetical protein [Sphingomonas sp. S6-11]UZK66492.1 hypothetical protein OKW87_01225 [Sphingomonas sp. S6-11]